MISTITKEKFLAYEKVRKSGKTNMLMSKEVSRLSKGVLSPEESQEIVRFYDDIKEVCDCKDMADVCELAHKTTIAFCKIRNIKVDGGVDENGELAYTKEAQAVFNKAYEIIIRATGL